MCLHRYGGVYFTLAFLLRWKKPILCGTENLTFTFCWVISGRECCITFPFPFVWFWVSEKWHRFNKHGEEMNPDVSERARLFISESDGENGLKMGRNMHVLTANLKGKIIDALKSVTRLSLTWIGQDFTLKRSQNCWINEEGRFGKRKTSLH